jgi:hypothetical protein
MSLAHGWVQACTNGWVGGMGGLRDGVGMGGLRDGVGMGGFINISVNV